MGGADFDFVGGDGTTNLGNDAVLEPAIDPSRIGSTVELKFDAATSYTYTQASFDADVARADDFSTVLNPLSISQAMGGIIQELFDEGTIKTLGDGKLVLYGSDGADEIGPYISRIGINVSDPGLDLPIPLSEYTDNGLVYVVGAGNDTVSGTGSNDVIFGGAGTDALFGEGGDDFIFFDAADGANVNGGDGRDVAVAVGQDGVTVDMGIQSLEVLIGGLGADSIVFRGAEEQMAAGGGGNDTFTLDFGEGNGLRTIWGGGGADEILAVSPNFLGVMVATVTGLTVENFHLFDRSMLGLGESFDWSAIDLLILNPDAGDRIKLDYGVEGVFDVMVKDYSQPVLANFADSTGDHYEVVTTVDFLGDATFGAPDWYGVQIGSYDTTDFISGYAGPVFTNAMVVEDEVVVFEYKVGETTYITGQEIGWEEVDGEPVVNRKLAEGIGLFGEGWNGEYDTEYDLSQAKGSSGWVQIGENEWISAHYFSCDYEDSIVGYNAGWYVVGGEIGGADGKEIVDTGAIHAYMTGIIGTVSDWLLAA